MSDIDQDYAYCETLIREGDKDRFLADLFAPAKARPHLHALQAFNLEIASVRHRVTEPMAGEIRLQWWRDVIAGEGRGEGPVAAALLDTVRRFELSGAALARIIDAQAFDFADEAMAELAALENYAANAAGTLFQLAAHVLAGGEFASYEAAARPAGVAYDLATMRRTAVSTHAWKGQARLHFDDAMAKVPALPRGARTAFLPLALVPLYLARDEVGQWRRQWALWRASRAWR